MSTAIASRYKIDAFFRLILSSYHSSKLGAIILLLEFIHNPISHGRFIYPNLKSRSTESSQKIEYYYYSKCWLNSLALMAILFKWLNRIAPRRRSDLTSSNINSKYPLFSPLLLFYIVIAHLLDARAAFMLFLLPI